MSWLEQAREFLESSRTDGGGWGYHAGGQASSEPTAFAVLAQRVLELDTSDGAAWLAGTQATDGSIPIQRDRAEPTWPTPHAILAWLAQDAGGSADCVQRASLYLMGRSGEHWDPEATPLLGHDTSIPGWPWVAGTHSWVEPTSFAVCALRRAGQGEGRQAQGRALLLNRVVKTGGWNYGNTRVLGAELEGFPAPTGLALVATLPELAGEEPIQRSIETLARQVEGVRAPVSLAWSLLGLRAAGRSPARAGEWIAASFERMTRRGLRTLDVSLLVLAAHAERALVLFGAAT